MAKRSIDTVTISTGTRSIDIPWAARNRLVQRLLESTLVDKFERHGTSSPIVLSDPEKAQLLTAIDEWIDEAEPDVPESVKRLRHEIAAEL
jgi:hypothetical protein